MANDWEVKDQKRRQAVARELDRRAFWKSVYVAAISLVGCSLDAEELANRALLDFDSKFKDLE